MSGQEFNGCDRRESPRKKPSTSIEVQAATDEKAQRKEVRKKPRHEINATCAHALVHEGLLLNLSSNGLKMRGKTPFDPGQNLNLTFLVPDDFDPEKQIPIYAICEVVWVKPSDGSYWHMGLEIKYMLSQHAQIYTAYLNSLPGQ